MEFEKVKLTNTATRKKENFVSIKPGKVGLYTCGPTVYSRAHIGNMRAYIFADILRRTLEYAGYEVNHVMNITDVGHLTSDADEGEDKMAAAARKERATAWQVAERYTVQFFEDESKLNIKKPKVICKATDHIKEQIELIKKLEAKGYVYKTADGIYFNTSKFSHYGDLAKLDIKGLQAGSRIGMGDKQNKTDFALWKFSTAGEKRDMEWDSPWGKGFPGWHIECSAMSMKYLGDTFDIHTGGIDHIPIHHTNEIAQSECATGKHFVNYWLHSDFLVMTDKEKMSKSLGNVINLGTLEEKKINPLAYRYLCLNSHYRKRLLFDEKILDSAVKAYNRFVEKISSFKDQNVSPANIEDLSSKGKSYLKEFKAAIFDDLNTPNALASMWTMLRDTKLEDSEKYGLVKEFDKVLALGIDSISSNSQVPKEVEVLVKQREEFRKSKDWAGADGARKKITSLGYEVSDTPQGPKVKKI
ncbi:MAG TPA: cysteine--tRNA ligase [Candidatus Nanoarchaeia archaeon]|nr:cysteine--tRNA ligase [Candidatus Nanoarchaeia archaeon]